jgi:hypothetical protein
VISGRAPLRIVFFLRAINFDRVFECFLRELLGRGHSVDVVFDREKRGLPETATRLFDAIGREFSEFSYELVPRKREWWTAGATTLRYTIDYLRYLEPEYAEAEALRARARARVPHLLRAAVWLADRFPGARRGLATGLRSLEAALPVSANLRRLIRERRPDVILVSPLVGLGEAQGDYLRAAAAEGVPTVLPVASWDNLTNKGVIRDRPTLTIVWNEAQVDEAARLHGLPRDRVVAVGAHTWDHWFDWRPSTTAEEFAEKVGLTPGRPFVLYVCSSHFIAGDEAEFITDWLRRMRFGDHAELRELGVVVRPHPQNVRFWHDADVSEPGLTVVYPRGGAAPTDAERKADYYDSLHHARAVVGINTSALVEAAIVRRPVLTVVTERFRATQEGTLHFSHLTGDDGLLLVARSWDEHFDQLADALQRPEVHQDRIASFLRRFVRPRGLDQPAAPLAVDAVERAAAAEAVPYRASSAARVAVAPAAFLVGIAAAIRHPRRLARDARKRAKRLRAAAVRG